MVRWFCERLHLFSLSYLRRFSCTRCVCLHADLTRRLIIGTRRLDTGAGATALTISRSNLKSTYLLTDVPKEFCYAFMLNSCVRDVHNNVCVSSRGNRCQATKGEREQSDQLEFTGAMDSTDVTHVHHALNNKLLHGYKFVRDPQRLRTRPLQSTHSGLIVCVVLTS